MSTTISFADHSEAGSEFLWDDIALSAVRLGFLLEPNGAKSEINVAAADGSKLVMSGTFNVTSPTASGTMTAFEVWQGSQQVMSAAFTHPVDVAEFGVGTGLINTEALILSAFQAIFGQHSVTAFGSADSDLIYGGHWDDTLNGGGRNDSLTGFDGNDLLNGGTGLDIAAYHREVGPLNVIVNFSNGNRTVGLETIAAGTAFDTYGFTDILNGVEGATGSPDSDWFFGSDSLLGFDVAPMSGGRGGDHFIAGAAPMGVDYSLAKVESGGAGVVVNLSGATAAGLAAGTGRDTFGDVDSFSGVKWIWGSHSNDRIVGGNTFEHLFGRGGADTIGGGKGNDRIEGDDGNDSIEGGKGKDTVSGGAGRDTMTGGDGADLFQFWDVVESKLAKRDFIGDFKHNSDRLDVALIDANIAKANDQKFVLDGMGTASSTVAKGHIGWYQVNKSGVVNDRTILRMNVDDDKTIEMSVELKGLIALDKGDFVL